MSDENTDLERRVLAHERILKALIAHLAKAEPDVLRRLRETFNDPIHLSRTAHDYTDTESYAEQFIHDLMSLNQAQDVEGVKTPENHATIRSAPPSRAVEAALAPRTSIAVIRKSGIWEMTRDHKFIGHYTTRAPALAAAEAAAHAIIAKGGAVELSCSAP